MRNLCAEMQALGHLIFWCVGGVTDNKVQIALYFNLKEGLEL